MLVGATGSGKSTLIDGMINYITDVSWEDDFRFSLIDVTQDEKKHQDDQVGFVFLIVHCIKNNLKRGMKIPEGHLQS